MPHDKVLTTVEKANQAIADLSAYLETQPIELVGHARVFEMFAMCLGICAKYEIDPRHLGSRCGAERF